MFWRIFLFTVSSAPRRQKLISGREKLFELTRLGTMRSSGCVLYSMTSEMAVCDDERCVDRPNDAVFKRKKKKKRNKDDSKGVTVRHTWIERMKQTSNGLKDTTGFQTPGRARSPRCLFLHKTVLPQPPSPPATPHPKRGQTVTARGPLDWSDEDGKSLRKHASVAVPPPDARRPAARGALCC